MAGPAVHHQLQPLLDGGRVHLAPGSHRAALRRRRRLRRPPRSGYRTISSRPRRVSRCARRSVSRRGRPGAGPAGTPPGPARAARCARARWPAWPASPPRPRRLGRRALLRDREGGAEGGDGLVVGEGRGGVVARHLEVPQGPLGLPGGGEVPAEHGGDLVRCGPATPPRAPRRRGRAAGGVRRAAARCRWPPGSGRGGSGRRARAARPPPAGGPWRTARPGPAPAARPRRTPRSAARAENSVPSTDAGRTASRAAGLSRSTRDRTRRSSACGYLRPAVRAQPPAALLAHQGPGLQQRGQPLLQEQRVAVDAGEHGVQDLLAGRRPR